MRHIDPLQLAQARMTYLCTDISRPEPDLPPVQGSGEVPAVAGRGPGMI